MEQDLPNAPNIDDENFDSLSLYENDRPLLCHEFLQDNLSSSSDEVPDSCCSSSVAERIELQQIPNSFSNALANASAMHAASFTKNPNNTVAIQQSSGITVGNKVFFTGPVVIKQFNADDDNYDILTRNETVNSNRVGNLCLMTKGNWLITIIVFVMVVALITTTTSSLTLINKLKGEGWCIFLTRFISEKSCE